MLEKTTPHPTKRPPDEGNGAPMRRADLAVAVHAVLTPSSIWRFALAVVLVGIAYGTREQLLPDAGDKSPFQTFVLAALVSSLVGGLGPGLLATVLGAGAVVYLYLPPSQVLAVEERADLLRLALFIMEGVLAAIAGHLIHRATAREQMLTRSAERFERFLLEFARSRLLQSDDQAPLYEELTEREIEVVRLLALGLQNDAIAERLFVSRNTVKTHLTHVYAKLGVQTRTEAVARSLDLGLLRRAAIAPVRNETDLPPESASPDAPSR
ncbi:MAG TPA: LuxR C-terminal-related transcriptional regulator [Patescibacteria group bacterium]|jgi:DNA-binding NarL/FixJ family response regulator|nr:LuxR C-terminal-related transcriptional regulator [Patescibacteria group bacterium]